MTSFHSFELGRALACMTEAAGPLAVDSPANSWIDYFYLAPCDFFDGVISLKSANSAIICNVTPHSTESPIYCFITNI